MTVSKKNIVIIGPAHPLRGGLASYNERLARAFQQNGHHVTIYTFSLQYPGFIFPGSTQYSTEPAPVDLDIKVEINSVNPVNWLIVGEKLKKLKPDVMILRYWLPLMGPCLGTISRLVKKNNHTRIVCIADNILPHEKRPGDRVFTKYFLKPIDAFITMSEKVLADLRIFEAEKPAKYIPHPLYDNFGEITDQSVAREKLGLGADEKIILFFGFIRKYKGLDILLDAMKILQDRNSRIKLLIAGEFYEDRKVYDDQIIKLGIEESLIRKTDFIADSDVKNYFCAADLVVQPYRNATQSGVTPLAYHFEIPMVVTNVGGLPSMVPDKVGLISEPTPEALADKVGEYFEKGREHFMPGLKEEKKKYSWQVIVDAILSF